MRYGRDYFVGVGDNVGSSVVEEIYRGMVRLDGEEIKGDTFGFINTAGRKRANTRKGKGASTSSGTGTKVTKNEKEDTRVRQRTRRLEGRMRGGGQWQAQIEQFQNASPEETLENVSECFK